MSLCEQPNLKAEIDGLKGQLEDKEKALDRACRFAAESTGSCPLDMFDFRARNCDDECSSDIDYAECWRMWFEREGE